ncbi:MAG: preprotein translocase subunit YajC [Clostridiales bacterium]|jgi:preprotein translocase subunit YajC|nr:preprotein translocase subunit YajC [Clostridiales bacterium]
MFRLFQLLETSAPADGNTASIGTILLTFAPFVVLIGVFYFLVLRPQKKQQRETESMRSSIERGDVITTVGGIVGVVITVKDDDILIETSGDKTRVQVKKWAVRSIEQKAD